MISSRGSWWRGPSRARLLAEAAALLTCLLAGLVVGVLAHGRDPGSWGLAVVLAAAVGVPGVVRGVRGHRASRDLWQWAQVAAEASDAEMDAGEQLVRGTAVPAGRRERTVALVVGRARLADLSERGGGSAGTGLAVVVVALAASAVGTWRLGLFVLVACVVAGVVADRGARRRLEHRVAELDALEVPSPG